MRRPSYGSCTRCCSRCTAWGISRCCAAASAAVYLIARLFCRDVVEEVEEKPEPTGNAELDKMISDGNLAIAEMKRLNESIKDEKISRQIDRPRGDLGQESSTA